MDMAPNRFEMGRAERAGPKLRLVRAPPPQAEPDRPARRSLDTLQSATQAAMMMSLVWPLIVAMPFFWAPPFWVVAGMVNKGRALGA